MSFLKNHPFAVEAFFKSSVVLTFAVPKKQLQRFLPPCLELDTYQDQWAFLAIAMVQTESLRPKGFPTWMGNDFFLIGYRIFVRYQDRKGRSLRGLYIIKSETDKQKMVLLGNLFTHYNYTKTDIQTRIEAESKTIFSNQSQFSLTIDQSDSEVTIPAESPFDNWKDARKFSGPLPHTFTYNEAKKTVLIIEGVRKNWKPKPIEVTAYQFAFLNQLQLTGAVLANAFEVKHIPYHWKKGRLEVWQP